MSQDQIDTTCRQFERDLERVNTVHDFVTMANLWTPMPPTMALIMSEPHEPGLLAQLWAIYRRNAKREVQHEG